MSKIVPWCPNVSWCTFLEKFFCSVFHGFIESFRKNQKNSKLQKCPRSYRKLCKLLLNMFCGNFSKKRMPRVPWRVGPSKKLKKKIKKFWKFQKSTKHSQKCANMFWTCFGAIFWKRFLPRVPWRVGPSKVFKKIKKIQKSKKAQNRFQKCPHVFWTCFGRCFWKFFAQCSMQCISDFLDLNIGVQFSETILNRLSFCIHATVNIRNPISDFLDSKLWVQIPQIKYVSSVFRT